MGLVGLVQLTQSILYQTLDNSQNQDGNAKNKVVAPEASSNQAANADTFVHSAQNPAQDAATFQVHQVSLFSAAANFLLQPAPAAPPAVAAPPAIPPANTQNADTTIAPANTAPAPTAQAAASAPAAATTTAATDATVIQQQLASLNDSLAVLGLSASEINVVDGVAQLIKDFNPAAFDGLINQLQSLAQASAPQIASAAAPAAAPSEVTLTLNNNNTGQTALIQSPQPQTAPAAAPLKAAAAAA